MIGLTIQERMFVGVVQTEKLLPRLTNATVRDAYTAECAALLARVRAMTGDEDEARAVSESLMQLHVTMLKAAMG